MVNIDNNILYFSYGAAVRETTRTRCRHAETRLFPNPFTTSEVAPTHLLQGRLVALKFDALKHPLDQLPFFRLTVKANLLIL